MEIEEVKTKVIMMVEADGVKGGVKRGGAGDGRGVVIVEEIEEVEEVMMVKKVMEQ